MSRTKQYGYEQGLRKISNISRQHSPMLLCDTPEHVICSSSSAILLGRRLRWLLMRYISHEKGGIAAGVRTQTSFALFSDESGGEYDHMGTAIITLLAADMLLR